MEAEKGRLTHGSDLRMTVCSTSTSYKGNDVCYKAFGVLAYLKDPGSLQTSLHVYLKMDST